MRYQCVGVETHARVAKGRKLELYVTPILWELVPDSDISEHYGHRIFDGSWSKQEAREKSILGYFTLLGIGLTGIRRVRVNSIAPHLNVEHAHSL